MPAAVPRAMAASPNNSDNMNMGRGDIPAIPALIPVKNESAERAVPMKAPSAADITLELSLSAAEGSVMTSAQSGKQLRRLSCFFARISPKSVRIPINKRTAFEIYTAPSRGSMLSAAADNTTDSHRTAAPANAAVSADIRENFIPALRMPMAAANMSAEVAAARSIRSVLSPPGSCYAAGDDCVTVKTFGRYAVKNIMMIKLVKGMITQWH